MLLRIRWFLFGLLSTAFVAYGAAVTILNDVLNSVQTYSLDNKFWVAYDTSIFPEFGCWYLDTNRISERPRLGRTPMGNYLTMARAKIGVTGKIDALTKDQQVFCNYLITGTGWTDPSLPPVVVPPVVPPVVATTITAPVGSITDATGGIWTFGTQTASGGNSLLLNGMPTNGFGKTLQLSAGKVFTSTADGKSFVWTGTNWVTGAP